MSTLARLVLVPVAATLVAAGCSRSGPAAVTNATPAPPAAATTAAPPATSRDPASPTTAAPAPATTSPAAPPATSAAPATNPTTTSGDVQEISVTVGVDDGRLEHVPVGRQVVITLQSDGDEAYHLHGYDLEMRAAAGTHAELAFTADQPGRFELESHTTGKVLLVLEVG